MPLFKLRPVLSDPNWRGKLPSGRRLSARDEKAALVIAGKAYRFPAWTWL